MINIYLDKLDKRVVSMWPVMTISDGTFFDKVAGAYCRFLDGNSKIEFFRIKLPENKDHVSNGCIVANINK